MEKCIHLSIVTYIPNGVSRTRLEICDKIIKSIKVARQKFTISYPIVLHIIVNKTESEDDERLSKLKEYIKSIIKFYKIIIDIVPNKENLLPDSRNRIIQRIYNNYPNYDNWIYQLDDDDEVTPEFFEIIDSAFSHGLLKSDRLNFFLFRQIRPEGNLLMPRSMHLTKLKDIYKPYFTWSSWNWIANVKWLVQNRILYPGLWLENAHLEDNFFNIRACLVKKEANLIMNATYVWDTMSTTTMSSWVGPHDKVLEYFKNKGAGFDITSAFMINETGYETIETEDDISNVLIKRINVDDEEFMNEAGYKIDPIKHNLHYDDLTNRLYMHGKPVRKIERLSEFVTKNSTYQLEMLVDFINEEDTPAKRFLRESCVRVNGKTKLKDGFTYNPYVVYE